MSGFGVIDGLFGAHLTFDAPRMLFCAEVCSSSSNELRAQPRFQFNIESFIRDDGGSLAYISGLRLSGFPKAVVPCLCHVANSQAGRH